MNNPAAAAPDELSAIGAKANDAPGTAGPELNPEAPKPGPSSAQVLDGLLKPLLQVLTPNWHINEKECAILSDAWGAVIDHHFPGGISTLGPWAAAMMVSAAVFAPRVVMKVPPRLLPPKTAAQPESANSGLLDPGSREHNGAVAAGLIAPVADTPRQGLVV